jgi:hypothetical protein
MGTVYRALQIAEDFALALDVEEKTSGQRKPTTFVREFTGYIDGNRAFIPKRRGSSGKGETISAAFTESTVNRVISKRFVQQQSAVPICSVASADTGLQ